MDGIFGGPTTPDVLTALTSFAVAVFRQRARSEDTSDSEWASSFWFGDPVLKSAARFAGFPVFKMPDFPRVVEAVFAQGDLADLGRKDGSLDPMVMHPGGGNRMSPDVLVASLFSSALLQIYYLRLPETETTFVRAVLDGFEELRRAAAGDRVRGYLIQGIAGITLEDGEQVNTPWGALGSAPPQSEIDWLESRFRPRTRCLLVDPKLLPIRFDRAPEPASAFDANDLNPARAQMLFPLACTLAADNPAAPGAPLITFSTLVLPFQLGLTFVGALLPPFGKPAVPIGARARELEEWARVVNTTHAPTVDIAARRLVSAVAHRTDISDTLIDAVMVWENLVGTSSETTFRVTAALAKLLERDRGKRHEVRKSLSQVYDVRSKVVHGVAIDPSKVQNAAERALDVAVRAVAASYRRGREWLALGSTERADTLLLQED